MSYEAYPKSDKAYRVILESHPEGVYVFVFETEQSLGPEQDHLQDDLEMAKLACREDFGITESDWTEIPDSNLRG